MRQLIAYDESNIVGADMYHLPKKGAMLWVQGEDRLHTVNKVEFLSGLGLNVVCTHRGLAWPPTVSKIRCKKEDMLPVTEETDDFKLYDLVVLKPQLVGLPEYENFKGVLMIDRVDIPNVYVHHTSSGYQNWIARADLLRVVLPDYS